MPFWLIRINLNEIEKCIPISKIDFVYRRSLFDSGHLGGLR